MNTYAMRIIKYRYLYKVEKYMINMAFSRLTQSELKVLIFLLKQGERSINEIAEKLDMKIANVSAAVSNMVNQDVAKKRKDGKLRYATASFRGFFDSFLRIMDRNYEAIITKHLSLEKFFAAIDIVFLKTLKKDAATILENASKQESEEGIISLLSAAAPDTVWIAELQKVSPESYAAILELFKSITENIMASIKKK